MSDRDRCFVIDESFSFSNSHVDSNASFRTHFTLGADKALRNDLDECVDEKQNRN